MAKFKVGDKVRRLPQYGSETGWSHGDTVKEVTGIVGSNDIRFDDECTGGWRGVRFELVEAAPEPAPVQHVSSRSNDPATSKTAGKPKRVSLREQLCIDFSVCGPQGLTGHEAALRFGGYHKLNSITPRFAELRREGKIKDSGWRRDKQIVWVLA